MHDVMPEAGSVTAPEAPASAAPLAPRHAHLVTQPTRRRILDLIHAEPGIKITQLCKRTEAGWGTVKYHLHLLERAGLIVTRAPGRDCLLFPSNFPHEALEVAQALRRGRAHHLASEIVRTPGATQKDLCARVRMTRKIIRGYVDLLTEAGLVTERRDNQYQRYYPNPRLIEHLEAPRAEPPRDEGRPDLRRPQDGPDPSP